MTSGKTIALIRQTFVSKVTTLLFNILSRLVIGFLPRSKHLLISWLQSPSAVILEPSKIVSHIVFPCICLEVMGSDAMIFVLNVEFKANIFTLLFHFHQEALCFSSFSAIRMVSSSYLRLLNHTNVVVPFETFKCS